MISAQSQEVARRAKRLYERKLRARVEAESMHQFVAVEPDSEDYFLGNTLSEAVRASKTAHPDKLTFAIRIGHKAAIEMMGAWV